MCNAIVWINLLQVANILQHKLLNFCFISSKVFVIFNFVPIFSLTFIYSHLPLTESTSFANNHSFVNFFFPTFNPQNGDVTDKFDAKWQKRWEIGSCENNSKKPRTRKGGPITTIPTPGNQWNRPGLTSLRHSALITSDSEYFQVCFSAVHYLKISEQRWFSSEQRWKQKLSELRISAVSTLIFSETALIQSWTALIQMNQRWTALIFE